MSNGQPLVQSTSILDFMKWDYRKSEIQFIPNSDVKSQFEKAFQKIDPNMSVEPSTPQGQIITILTDVVLTVIDNYQTITNTLFFGGSGFTLDNWAFNNYGVKRRSEEMGSVTMKINGTPNTIIESTDQNRFKVTDGTLTFELLNNIIIAEDGEVIADFVCTEFSTKVAKQSTINQIATSRINVERVINTISSSPGIPAEDDISLYLRCIQYGSVFNNSTFRSMVSNLYQTKGVLKVNAKENISTVALQYKGVSVPPHGVAFVILGGTTDDIAETFLNTKTPGTAMAGDQECVTYFERHKLTYKIYRPTEIPLKVEVEVQTSLDMPANYEDIIKDRLIETIDRLEIGTLVTLPLISCSITNLGILLKEIKFSKKTDSPGYNVIDLQFREMATLDREDITVKKT